MHIVEEFIYERAPKITARPRFFLAIKPLLYRVLAYDDAVMLADQITKQTGREAFTLVTDHIQPCTVVTDMSNLPATGKCIVIANHPTGLADGIAVFQAIRERRPDHVFLANADALRVMPKADDIIIPVEWVIEKRTMAKTMQTLIDVKRALEAEKCIVIFPSGRLAKLGLRGLYDHEWQSSAAMLAKKYEAPVIPLKIRARNSWLYYFFARVNNELRDITLFYELLNKRDKTFKLKFGTPIPSEDLPKNSDKATEIIRKVVEEDL